MATNQERWPEIKWGNGYFYFTHGGRRYTALRAAIIGMLLRATMAPLSIHNRPVPIR